MSEEVEEFDLKGWRERSKELRKLDIFISEHLYGRPVFMWWWVSNHDGDDMIEYFNHESYLDDYYKEPLYEIKKGDYDYNDIIENHPDHVDEAQDIHNGVHRWNLRQIPRYSQDLGLIYRCEEKLVELGYDTGVYVERIEMISGKSGRFDSVHATAEVRAMAMIEMIKNKIGVE
jgi:hypothetical protein